MATTVVYTKGDRVRHVTKAWGTLLATVVEERNGRVTVKVDGYAASNSIEPRFIEKVETVPAGEEGAED